MSSRTSVRWLCAWGMALAVAATASRVSAQRDDQCGCDLPMGLGVPRGGPVPANMVLWVDTKRFPPDQLSLYTTPPNQHVVSHDFDLEPIKPTSSLTISLLRPGADITPGIHYVVHGVSPDSYYFGDEEQRGYPYGMVFDSTDYVDTTPPVVTGLQVATKLTTSGPCGAQVLKFQAITIHEDFVWSSLPVWVEFSQNGAVIFETVATISASSPSGWIDDQYQFNGICAGAHGLERLGLHGVVDISITVYDWSFNAAPTAHLSFDFGPGEAAAGKAPAAQGGGCALRNQTTGAPTQRPDVALYLLVLAIGLVAYRFELRLSRRGRQ